MMTRLLRLWSLATPCNGNCNAVPSEVGAPFSAQPRTLALANHDEPEPARLLGLANELEIGDDGWALIPYGESRHSGRDGRTATLAAANSREAGDSPRPVVQVFDRAAADAIVADFYSPLTRFKRFVVGLPIFKGHPDSPRWAKFFPDKNPRGTIAEMQATDAGLRFKPVLHDNGRDDVGAGWSRFSPYWRSVFAGLRDDGFASYRPNKLWSIGLLPPGRENIAGLSLANAAEPVPTDSLDHENPTTTANIMKDFLLKLLAALNINVPANATDEQIGSLVGQAGATIAAANAKDETIATLTREKATLSEQITTATSKAQQAELALTNAVEAHATALKVERTARARLLVTAAVKEGRITAADLEPQTLSLANAADFESEAQKIAQLPPKLKTQTALGQLAQSGKEQQSRQATVLNLVNARMEAHREDYDAAFAAVQKDPKHAALFTAMKQPAAGK